MRLPNSPLAAFLLLWALSCASAANAGSGEPGWTLELMMNQLQQIGERSARFTETREPALLEQPIEQTGTLSFQPPDRLIRTLSPPSDSRYEIEGNRLTLWQGGRQQQTLLLDNLPGLLAFSASFRSVLAGDLETLQSYFVTRLSGDESAWKLTLTPKQSGLARQIARIDIDGRRQEIDRYTVVETSGDQTITHLTPVRE